MPIVKAVVTGGAGFIGSHLVDALLAQGADVRVVDDLSTGDAGRVAPAAALHAEDVRGDAARRVIAAAKPDVVFHLAAQADVQRSIRDPLHDLSVNVAGTVNLLEGLREAGGGKLVFASTAGVYGNLLKARIAETDPAEPISFYGLSKLAAERYIRLYGASFGVPYTVLRFANVYGPRQTSKGEGGVVAVFMEKAANGEPLVVNGDGRQTRDFVYVADVVRALLAASVRGEGRTLHVSTGEPTSVNRLVELLRGVSGGELAVRHGPAKPGDIVHSCLSNAQSREALGWQPAVAIGQGLRETYRHWQGAEAGGRP